MDVRVLIRQREELTAQLMGLKEKGDPLCTSVVGGEIWGKLMGEIKRMRGEGVVMGRGMVVQPIGQQIGQQGGFK